MVKGGVVEVGVGDEGREDQVVSSICRGGEGERKGRSEHKASLVATPPTY